MRQTIHTIVMLLAAMAAGYVGGLVSQHTAPAGAQGTGKAPVVQEVVRAKRFELVDGKGKKRGVFRVENGKPGIAVCDNNGTIRGDFSLLTDGPCLSLYDANGMIRGMFDLTAGYPVICMLDENQSQRWVMTADPEPSLIMYDAHLKQRGRFELSVDMPLISLCDDSGRTRLELKVYKKENALRLYDTEGVERGSVILNDDKSRIVLSDPKGITRAVLGSTSLISAKTGVETKLPESSLVLFDTDGHVMQTFPQ